MATFVKYNQFVQDLGRKVHNLNSDTLKFALTNTAPTVATNAVLADIAEISAGNGYSAGGAALTGSGYTQTSGTGKLTGTAPTITATGAIGPFRYVVLYNSTAASGPLIAYFDYGSSITMANTETFAMTESGDVLDIA